MVKIAVAGGSSGIAQEIVDVLAASGKHEIVLLSRKDAPTDVLAPGVTWAKTDYGDVEGLVAVLQGIHTVLSFIVTHSDVGNVSQKHLIDAAVRAGVKRFAPSEWASSSLEYLSWYAGKGEIRAYLEELNREKKILEYSLFQPGLLVNYFTHPFTSTKHVTPIETPFDFHRRRALIVDGHDDSKISLITMRDLAGVVARAVDYAGEWPVVGGIRGTELTIAQLIALGEEVRGGPFIVDRLKAQDLEAGRVAASWLPGATHPSFESSSSTPEQRQQSRALVEKLTSGLLLGISAGALCVSDEWNRLLPDYEFTSADEFLRATWRGK